MANSVAFTASPSPASRLPVGFGDPKWCLRPRLGRCRSVITGVLHDTSADEPRAMPGTVAPVPYWVSYRATTEI
jgi:hypothetical protein